MTTPDLIARIKDVLRGPEGDDYTDAGMEDAFFRWPVIERAILATLDARPVVSENSLSPAAQSETQPALPLTTDRAIVLEEAAKVAEDWQSSLRPGSADRLAGHREAARDIAAAIRSLTDTSPPSR